MVELNVKLNKNEIPKTNEIVINEEEIVYLRTDYKIKENIDLILIDFELKKYGLELLNQVNVHCIKDSFLTLLIKNNTKYKVIINDC